MVSYEERVIEYLEKLWKNNKSYIRRTNGGTQRRQKLICSYASGLQVKTRNEPEGIN